MVRRKSAPLSVLMGACIAANLAFAQENQDAIEGEPANSEGQIMVAEPDGSKMRPLTQLKDYVFQGSPEWSRDGKIVVFDCRYLGMNNNGGSRIAVVNSDGTNPRVLGPGMMPSPSPKGNQIAFSDQKKGGVWLQSISEPIGEPRLLDERGWGTAWSPDGTSVAFAAFSQGANMMIFDVIEGAKRPLFPANNSGYQRVYWNFAWSPDSTRIAFKGTTSDGKNVLAIVDARGSEHGHTVRYEGNFLPTIAWSPDGKQLLFSADCPERSNLKQIYYVDVDSTDPPKLLPQQAANRQLEDMSFSPDGGMMTLMAMPVRK